MSEVNLDAIQLLAPPPLPSHVEPWFLFPDELVQLPLPSGITLTPGDRAQMAARATPAESVDNVVDLEAREETDRVVAPEVGSAAEEDARPRCCDGLRHCSMRVRRQARLIPGQVLRSIVVGGIAHVATARLQHPLRVLWHCLLYAFDLR